MSCVRIAMMKLTINNCTYISLQEKTPLKMINGTSNG
jgi:hypothetical protein